jgi:hypothetical protein
MQPAVNEYSRNGNGDSQTELTTESGEELDVNGYERWLGTGQSVTNRCTQRIRGEGGMSCDETLGHCRSTKERCVRDLKFSRKERCVRDLKFSRKERYVRDLKFSRKERWRMMRWGGIT